MINRLYIPFYSHQKYINCSCNDCGMHPDSCNTAVFLREAEEERVFPPLAAHQRRFPPFFETYLLFMFSISPAGKHMLSFKLGKLQSHVKTT